MNTMLRLLLSLSLALSVSSTQIYVVGQQSHVFILFLYLTAHLNRQKSLVWIYLLPNHLGVKRSFRTLVQNYNVPL
jgi:hypothetical protein